MGHGADRLSAAEAGLKGAMDRLHSSLWAGTPDLGGLETCYRSSPGSAEQLFEECPYNHAAQLRGAGPGGPASLKTCGELPSRGGYQGPSSFAAEEQLRQRLQGQEASTAPALEASFHSSRRHSISSSHSYASRLSRHALPEPGCEAKAAEVSHLCSELSALANVASRAAVDCPRCAPLADALRSQALQELASLRSALMRFQESAGARPEEQLSERRLAELSASTSKGLALLTDALGSAAPVQIKRPEAEDVIEEARAELTTKRQSSAPRLSRVPSSFLLERQSELAISSNAGYEAPVLADSLLSGPPLSSFASFSSPSKVIAPSTDSLAVTPGGDSSKMSPSSTMIGSPARPVFAEVFGSIAANMQRSLSDIRETKRAQAMSRSPGSEASLHDQCSAPSLFISSSSPGDLAAGVGPGVTVTTNRSGGKSTMPRHEGPVRALWPPGLQREELGFAKEFLKAAAAADVGMATFGKDVAGALAAAGGA